MAQGEDWSLLEVEACVADYLEMLTLELNGQRYSKTEHANALMKRLDGRNRPSIEFKHCNISAVLLSLGYPHINGYKPRGNVQGLLFDVVEAQVGQHAALQQAASAAVNHPATAPTVLSLENIWVPAPAPKRVKESMAPYAPRFSPARRDYLAREAQNRSLGQAGELLVAELEVRRLHAAGKTTLANRVEHVAATQGDGLGYDVLSFEENGQERLIEVKTTRFGQLTPFYVSRTELARSRQDAPLYHLYRLFDFRQRPRLFSLQGDIEAHCQLAPVSYLAELAG